MRRASAVRRHAGAPGVTIRGPVAARYRDLLSSEALAFLATLHRRFDAQRRTLLAERAAVDPADADPPTWAKTLDRQVDLKARWAGKPEGSEPETDPIETRSTTPAFRPRGWHLAEQHLAVDDRPTAAALFDFGLYAFHNARAAAAQGLALPLDLRVPESDGEAQLWNDVIAFAQETLALPDGSIKVTPPVT